MASIKYTRGTTYTITHTYTGPYAGMSLLFTAKLVENDSDATDVGSNVIVKKTVAMTGSMPQSTLVTIDPADVADTIEPDEYFFDMKVIDSTGAIYQVVKGSFVLLAGPTNRLS